MEPAPRSSSSLLDLTGSVAIVTGAAQGLGRVEAVALARRGAQLVLADIRDPSEVVREISALGADAVGLEVNLDGAAGAERLLEFAVDAFGAVDVVINNAGIVRDRMSFNLADEDWDAVLRVNLTGPFMLCRAAASRWRASPPNRRRVLLNTSSESGLYGNVGQANYAAAKAGVAALTLSLAAELDRYAVRVNAIAPRARTPMSAAAFGSLPMGNGLDPFDPEQVASLVAWLCSEAATGVTGQIFVVHGAGIELLRGWTVQRRVIPASAWTDEALLSLRGELFDGVDAGHVPVPVKDLFDVPSSDRRESCR